MSDKIELIIFTEATFDEFLKQLMISTNKLAFKSEKLDANHFVFFFEISNMQKERGDVRPREYYHSMYFNDVYPVSQYLRVFLQKIELLKRYHFVGHDSYSLELIEHASKNMLISSVTHFPKIEVQKYGRDKLLSAPCELIEEWEDGSIFMMIRKDSFKSTFEERQKLREHVGEVAK